MKKYLSTLLAIFFLTLFVFIPGAETFATLPSFEIYCNPDPAVNPAGCARQNSTSYPTIIGTPSIPETPTVNDDGTITELITAEVVDVSGVAGVSVIIKNSSGDLMDEETMSNAGTTFFKEINVTNYSVDDTYTVGFITLDNLANSSGDAYADEGSFTMGTPSTPNCQVDSASGAEICINVKFSVPKATEIVSNPLNSVNAGNSVNLSATLEYVSNERPISGQTIIFTDETDSVNIGSATTDSSGLVSISYPTSLSASAGSHEIEVQYAGEPSEGISPSQGIIYLTVNNNSICQTDSASGAEICIDISSSD